MLLHQANPHKDFYALLVRQFFRATLRRIFRVGPRQIVGPLCRIKSAQLYYVVDVYSVRCIAVIVCELEPRVVSRLAFLVPKLLVDEQDARLVLSFGRR